VDLIFPTRFMPGPDHHAPQEVPAETSRDAQGQEHNTKSKEMSVMGLLCVVQATQLNLAVA